MKGVSIEAGGLGGGAAPPSLYHFLDEIHITSSMKYMSIEAGALGGRSRPSPI